MKSVRTRSIARPALALSALAFGGALAGSSAASQLANAASPRAATASSPVLTVTASLITRRPGTLPPGTKVKSSALGARVFPNARHGFALADVGEAQYPAASTDGGKTWKTDGPALHINAAQAPLSVVYLGATSTKTIFAYGSGQVIDTTSDGGKHWYSALFTQGTPMAVVGGFTGHLVAFVDAPTSSSGTSGVTWQYVSKNGGRSWRYDATVGGS